MFSVSLAGEEGNGEQEPAVDVADQDEPELHGVEQSAGEQNVAHGHLSHLLVPACRPLLELMDSEALGVKLSPISIGNGPCHGDISLSY